jgi:hypothetical protein
MRVQARTPQGHGTMYTSIISDRLYRDFLTKDLPNNYQTVISSLGDDPKLAKVDSALRTHAQRNAEAKTARRTKEERNTFFIKQDSLHNQKSKSSCCNQMLLQATPYITWIAICQLEPGSWALFLGVK